MDETKRDFSDSEVIDEVFSYDETLQFSKQAIWETLYFRMLGRLRRVRDALEEASEDQIHILQGRAKELRIMMLELDNITNPDTIPNKEEDDE